MTNVEAAERTIRALAGLGRLEEVDVARVEALRTLAAAVDENPANAALHREYRDSLSDLRFYDDDDGFSDALEDLRTSVRDSEED
jgi:hypothetical protein